MPAKDHRGTPLPPAEQHPDVDVDVRGGRVRVGVDDEAATLSEPQTRGLIMTLNAAWHRAFGERVR